MTPDPYDRASRYLVQRQPTPMVGWLLRLPAGAFEFVQWLDTRRIPWPGSTERACDTVAWLLDAARGGVPWAVVLEFQIAPDADMASRLLVYLGSIRLDSLPSRHPGDRFAVGAVVVNLTGNGQSGRDMDWPEAGLRTTVGIAECNLAGFDASRVLDEVGAGATPRALLAWVPLMQQGGEDGIIARWLVLAGQEPDAELRADLGLALVFAEKLHRAEKWKKALEGYDVVESEQVKEWQAQALDRGREEGRLVGQIQVYQELLGQPISPSDDLLRRSAAELTRMAEHLKHQLNPRTNGHS